jgi:hypothetical protein
MYYHLGVRCCMVQMLGKDRRTHTLTLEAASLFDAADQAINQWSRLWWFDPQAALHVQSCEDRWTVKQENVRQWRLRPDRSC